MGEIKPRSITSQKISRLSSEYSCNPRDKNPTRQDHTLKKRYSTDFKQCNYFLAQITGQCISVSPAVIPGIETHTDFWQTSGRLLAEDRMIIDLKTQRDKKLVAPRIQRLEWSCSETKCYTRTDFTDASAIGWGAHLQNRKASGHWNYQLFKKTSNYRELMTVRLALLSFAPYIQGKCVQIVSDNITTVAYLNHLGGPVQELSVLTETIFT